MQPHNTVDVAIIGGGIVGMSVAMALSSIRPQASIAIIESEKTLFAHQTSHNSGVIHSGLYYKPGSSKARNCAAGREAMIKFCEAQAVPYERCGKIVVATHNEEISMLKILQERAIANGLKDIKWLSGSQIQEYEPHAQGVAGLWIGETGIVNYTQVGYAMASVVKSRGAEILTDHRVQGCIKDGTSFIIQTNNGDIRCRFLINCAGLYSDKVAKLCGITTQVQIIPFRGEYYELVTNKRHLVKNLIYPVPDPRFPFLGVHFTRSLNGSIEAGPNAVLALKREGYQKTDFSLKDVCEFLSYRGFWRMAYKYWKMGLSEWHRSLSKQAFVRALQKLVPAIQSEDLIVSGSGVRAQALNQQGMLVDDFSIVASERMIHVLNAPSPAATASIAIGEHISMLAQRWLK